MATSADSPLSQYFYVSQLACGSNAASVAAILAQAREGNARHGITGLLVFDGQNFVQYLEGPSAAVQSLAARIAADPRHAGMSVLHRGPLPRRRCARYELGYADPTEEGALTALLGPLRGEPALMRFLSMRTTFDVRL